MVWRLIFLADPVWETPYGLGDWALGARLIRRLRNFYTGATQINSSLLVLSVIAVLIPGNTVYLRSSFRRR